MPARGERRFRSTSTASAFSGETYTTRHPRAGDWISASIDERNAASVLPDPVGAEISTCSPDRIAGHGKDAQHDLLDYAKNIVLTRK